MMKFLLGLGLGFVGALLFAPAPGEETRSRLFAKARNLADDSEQKMNETMERVSDAAREKAGEIGSAIGRQAAEAVADSLIGRSEAHPA